MNEIYAFAVTQVGASQQTRESIEKINNEIQELARDNECNTKIVNIPAVDGAATYYLYCYSEHKSSLASVKKQLPICARALEVFLNPSEISCGTRSDPWFLSMVSY